MLAHRAAAVIGPTPVHLNESRHAAALLPRGIAIGYPFDRSRLPTPTGTSAAAAKVRAFARGRKLTISIGRLVPYKGFDMLIEAARHFDGALASIIVGEGPLADELQATIARRGVGDRVMLTGPIDDAALADLLDLADIGCMPSVTAAEMYGVAQVEMMAFGMPVVSTRLPRSGVSYVNQDQVTGLIVPPGDPDALARALLSLAGDDDLRRRLGEGAARSFAADHDIGPIGERYARLIRDVVARGRIGRRSRRGQTPYPPPVQAE